MTDEKELFVIRKRTPEELQRHLLMMVALHEVMIKTLEKRIDKLEEEKKK